MLLWRYLTDEACQRFLEDSRLGLSRIASFEDAYECMVPAAAYHSRHPDGRVKLDYFEGSTRQVRSWASCWFADEHESIAMWQLFVGHGPGVAISVLLPDLQSLAPSEGLVAPVQYVRHDDGRADIAFDREELWPFLKLWGFRHESEVRLVVPERSDSVSDIDSSERWAFLADSNLHSIVRHARVFGPDRSDSTRLRDALTEALPTATIEASRAWPNYRLGSKLIGFGTAFPFESRMRGFSSDGDRGQDRPGSAGSPPRE